MWHSAHPIAGYYTEDSTAASRKEAAKDLKWNLQTTTKQAAGL